MFHIALQLTSLLVKHTKRNHFLAILSCAKANPAVGLERLLGLHQMLLPPRNSYLELIHLERGKDERREAQERKKRLEDGDFVWGPANVSTRSVS